LDLVIEILRDNPHLLSARFSGNKTLLLEAAYAGQREIADRLLAMDAKMDFITAIALGRSGVVLEMLKENPGLVRKHSPDRWAAIHIAARYADTEMLALLVSAGADVNDSSNTKGLTPLFFAWKEPHDNAEVLLTDGADIDARGKHGFTVLHYAAMTGRLTFVRFLLAHGACSDIQTDGRQTPWALAVRHGHRAVAALLNSR
jgi:ankyrin repeat protein